MLFKPTPSPYRPHDPTWRQPLYLHLRPLWRATERALGSCEGRLLDVGCGLQPYRPMAGPKVTEYIGLDREGPLSKPDVVGDADALPFEDGAFDVVFSTQVYEHLPDPHAAMAEAARVLRPGGRLLISVPGVWPTHEAPYDFWRYTRHGLLHMLDRHGFEVTQLEALGRLWATVGQMANLELQRLFLLRNLVPLVNLLCAWADRGRQRQDLALNWMVDAVRRPR